jgi:hypothetical protein
MGAGSQGSVSGAALISLFLRLESLAPRLLSPSSSLGIIHTNSIIGLGRVSSMISIQMDGLEEI